MLYNVVKICFKVDKYWVVKSSDLVRKFGSWMIEVVVLVVVIFVLMFFCLGRIWFEVKVFFLVGCMYF